MKTNIAESYYLTIAQAVSVRSDCRRAKAGAVIVDTNERIVGTGYPGAEKTQRGCLVAGCSRGVLGGLSNGTEECTAVHAEMEALNSTDPSRIVGGAMYVTREPCSACYRAMAAAGVATVVFRAPSGYITVDLAKVAV